MVLRGAGFGDWGTDAVVERQVEYAYEKFMGLPPGWCSGIAEATHPNRLEDAIEIPVTGVPEAAQMLTPKR